MKTSYTLRYTLLFTFIISGFFSAKAQIDPSRDQNTIYSQHVHAVMDTETHDLGAANNELNFNKGVSALQTAFSADTRLKHIIMKTDRQHVPELTSEGNPYDDINNFRSWLQDGNNNADPRDYHIRFSNPSNPSYEGETGGGGPFSGGLTISAAQGGYDAPETIGHEYGWASGSAGGYEDGLSFINLTLVNENTGDTYNLTDGKTLEKPNTGGYYLHIFDTPVEFNTGSISNGGSGIFSYKVLDPESGHTARYDIRPENMGHADVENIGDGQHTTTGIVNYFNTYQNLRKETSVYNPDTNNNEAIKAPVAPQFSQSGNIITLTNADKYGLKIPNTTDPNFAGIYYTSGQYEFYIYETDNVANDQYVKFNAVNNAGNAYLAHKISLEQLQNGFDISNIGLDSNKTYKIGTYEMHSNGMDFTTSISGQTFQLATSDNISPVANCQSTTVELGADGTATIDPMSVNNNSTDNVGIVSYTVSPNTVNCSDVGEITVTLTVADAEGNSDSCATTITVADNTNPTLTTKNFAGSLDADGNYTANPNDFVENMADNCGIDTVELSQTNFSCADVGVNTIQVTVTDHNGKTTTKNAELTLTDNTNPTLTTKNFAGTLDANGNYTANPNDFVATKSDNCGIDTVVLSQTNFSCADVGVNTVQVTITDHNGNTTTKNAELTLTDEIGPTMPTNLNCSEINSTSAVLNFEASTDNCADSLTYNIYLDGQVYGTTNATSFTFENLNPETSYTVSVVVVDASGNALESEQLVFNTPLSIYENKLPGFAVFPNPVQDRLQIKNTNALNIVSVVISDDLGREVLRQEQKGQPLSSLSFGNYASGTYLVKFVTADGNFGVYKIIKQ